MQRRNFKLAAAAFGTSATRGQQYPGPQHTLPVAPSSPGPYAKLQVGAPHHMTPERESQRVTNSTAPAALRGRWVARAALPIPRSEIARATAAVGRMHRLGGYGKGAVNRGYHPIYDLVTDRCLNGTRHFLYRDGLGQSVVPNGRSTCRLGLIGPWAICSFIPSVQSK